VIAVDGLRVTAANIERRLRSYPVGASVLVFAFRRDELMQFNVKLQPELATRAVLTTLAAPAEAVQRRKAWLGSAGA
jgi:predicted metalloprotease with PDZ domain